MPLNENSITLINQIIFKIDFLRVLDADENIYWLFFGIQHIQRIFLTSF